MDGGHVVPEPGEASGLGWAIARDPLIRLARPGIPVRDALAWRERHDAEFNRSGRGGEALEGEAKRALQVFADVAPNQR